MDEKLKLLPSWPEEIAELDRVRDAAWKETTIAEALRLHRQWLDTQGKEGRRLDLCRADMRGANFTGADMSGANFSVANMTRAVFFWTLLRDVDFTLSQHFGAAAIAALNEMAKGPEHMEAKLADALRAAGMTERQIQEGVELLRLSRGVEAMLQTAPGPEAIN